MSARDEIAAHFASPLLASTLLDAHAAEVCAEAVREAADALAEQAHDICAYGEETNLGTVGECADLLRRRADEIAPPSALRRAHAALAEQAGRDQAALERVRAALAPLDWAYAQIAVATVRAALDGPPEPNAAPPQHLAAGSNAERCPACDPRTLPYPFLCPGPTEERPA